MKDTEWMSYGIDNEKKDKLFRILNDRIYFAFDKAFNIEWEKFLDCILKMENIPVTNEDGTDEIPVMEADNYTVALSRTVNHDKGDDLQLGISKRDGGKWVSWIRFTMEELQAIVAKVE